MARYIGTLGLTGALIMAGCASAPRPEQAAARWMIGTPIATYWAGPAMTEATARQMVEGGWNLVWCQENELDMAQRFGLRALLQNGLLDPSSLDSPAKLQELDALIGRVKNHPALYAYHITDEPNTARFPDLGRLVAHLRQQDPAHLAYINLFPTYASNEQLGATGDTVPAYTEHLRQYVEKVKPDLISYDHYHYFIKGKDGEQYFLNLGLIRQKALDSGVPFLNIVQAASWDPGVRVPNEKELRWLVYTSLAYGAQGISYYVYCYPKHEGAMALADGTPTPLYHEASKLNREFVAIASELQPLRSLTAGHIGAVPLGAKALPTDAPLQVTPAATLVGSGAAAVGPGLACGLFGRGAKATHAVIVNLDYAHAVTTRLTARRRLEVFDATARCWQPASSGKSVALELQPGDGKLVRWAR
jgi:hypothetical protein